MWISSCCLEYISIYIPGNDKAAACRLPFNAEVIFHINIRSAAPNPLALVTVAHLHTRRTRDAPYDRFQAKRRLVRLLYERNWSKSRILGFFAVLDWMMRLPEELETELWHDIESIEGERKVKYVTSVERLAIKRGIEQGLEQGLARGRMEGRAEGIAVLLSRQLNRRFGPLSAATTDRLAKAAPDQLERWAERVLDAATLDDVFAES